jgi:hypothetical protein
VPDQPGEDVVSGFNEHIGDRSSDFSGSYNEIGFTGLS